MIKDFDCTYEEYVKRQIARAGKKWSCPPFWHHLNVFRELVLEVLRFTNVPKEICCMGIRNGNEYFAFKEFPGFQNVDVYGVDIHPDVTKVGKNCFSYDFNELPKEWEKKFEWVYSNSLDHSYDVKKTLTEWHRVCKGYLILTLSCCEHPSASDMYTFRKEDVPELFDNSLFEVIKVYEDDKTKNAQVFNVILKVK